MKTDYDEFGNIVSEQDLTTGAIIKSYEYDAASRLTKVSDYDKMSKNYFYTSDDRLSQMDIRRKTDSVLLYSEAYTYDDAYNNGQYAKVTKVIQGDTNSPSITTNTYTNKNGQLEKQERIHVENSVPKTYTDTFKYDYLSNKIEEKIARAYDENWTQPYTSKYEYNFAGKVTKKYNINGDYSTTEYDALGRVKSVTDIKGNIANPVYSTTYTYDNLGRVLEEKVPFTSVNGTIYYSVKKHYFDRNGNTILEKITKNKPEAAIAYNQTGYEYNNRNMLTKVINYDNGNPANYTQYYYDNVGNKIRMYTGLSSPLQINGLDNIVATGDVDYSVTKYEYNQFNTLVKMIDPLGNAENYTYDLNGYLTQKLDRNGNTTTMTYDGLGRIFTKSVNCVDGKANTSYSYSYSLTGNRVSMVGGSYNSTYAYDDLGRLKTETESNGIQKEYTYNANDNRISFIIKQNGIVKTNTSYTYDNLNRLYQMIDNGIVTATYQYDANGNRLCLTYSNGNTTEYQYNLENKLTNLTNKKGAAILSQYEYVYYLDGTQESKTDSTGNTTYVYDGLGRLSTVSEPGGINTSYQYDDYSNRKTMTITGGENAGTTNYGYDKNNRLLTEEKTVNNVDEVTQYSYDNNGNQIFKAKEVSKPITLEESDSFSMFITGENGNSTIEGLTIFEYDGFNQLIKSTIDNQITSYTYNGDGLRQSKIMNGEIYTHIWDGQDIVLELDGTANVRAKYLRGINLITYEDGIGIKKYYMFNGHGDVTSLTDGSGNVIKSYDYDAFGNEKNPDVNDTNVFRYCGEYFDKETGTIYLRARYYDPEMGRFINEDSYEGQVTDPLSLNLYTYCGNDPINNVDPSGNSWDVIGQDLNYLKNLQNEYINGSITNTPEAIRASANRLREEIMGQTEFIENWMGFRDAAIAGLSLQKGQYGYSVGSAGSSPTQTQALINFVSEAKSSEAWGRWGTEIAFDAALVGTTYAAVKSPSAISKVNSKVTKPTSNTGNYKMNLQQFAKNGFPKGSPSGKDVVNFLKKEGFKKIRQDGSHCIMKGPKGEVVPVPVHGNQSIPIGTLNSIKKLAGY